MTRYVSIYIKEHLTSLEKHRGLLSKVKEKKEQLEVENYRQKLFIANRKAIESNIQVELRAIKIVRLWQEKRKARFVKQIYLQKIVLKLANDYMRRRGNWLNFVKSHLMALRIQKRWKSYIQRRGKTREIRISRMIKPIFKFQTSILQLTKVEHKCQFIYKDFLTNISSKIGINSSFLAWYKKVEKVQNFLRSCYQRKQTRVQAMQVYWDKLIEKADWYIMMSNNSGMLIY